MQHLKKIPRTSMIQIWHKIWSFIYQNFEENWFFRNSTQIFFTFLANSVYFLDSHSRCAKNDSFILSPTSFLKKVWEHLDHSRSEKCQLISWAAGVLHTPASFRVNQWDFYHSNSSKYAKNNYFVICLFSQGGLKILLK